METSSRRAFLAFSAGGMCAVYGSNAALAALRVSTFGTYGSARIGFANALNFRLFAQNRETLGLTAVMAIRPVDGELGSYRAGSLFLFPFNRGPDRAGEPAFLPGPDVKTPLIKAVPMTTLGLPPDEFFCHYVLQAPWAVLHQLRD